MQGTVPGLSIVCMVVSGLIGFAIPVILCVYIRRKKRADIVPFFIGCAVMMVFALTLESLLHQLVFKLCGDVLQNHILLYALYGGLMAGLFEETGRFLAFSTVLKKMQGKDVNALMYGAGHGGFEALMILGVGMINNIVYAVLINTGRMTALLHTLPKETRAQMEAAVQALVMTSPPVFLVGSLERVLAVMLQIALSVLVWFAAKDRSKRYLFPTAILIHLAVDAAAVLLSGKGAPVLVIEAVVAVMTAAVVFFAREVWKSNAAEQVI